MPKKRVHESFSESFWSESSESGLLSTPSSLSLNRKKSAELEHLLYPVDESPEFHDPYSNLSLFLSREVKKETSSNRSKWTIKLQEDLLQKISPKFQKKFPQYRLGVSAVKKIWEKIQFYTEQVQEKSEAIDQNGKLNVNFFIKENLKQYFQQKASSFLNPYQFAYHVASKMSECIATLEGKKTKIDLLTKTVWCLQKHLLKSSPLKALTPVQEEFDKADKLIVKTVLETTAKHPHISLEDLEYKTKESLQALHDLPCTFSSHKMTCSISALLAEKLYATSPFHLTFFSEQKEAMQRFIKKHTAIHKNTQVAPHIPALVRRISALYVLASHLPKDISEKTFFSAVQASLASSKERPALPQPVYAFISAELCLLKGESAPLTEEKAQKSIWQSYKEALALRPIAEEEKDLLEVVTWKVLSETEGLLEKLPYRTGAKIEEEIASILIDNPGKGFSSVVQETLGFFRKAKELTEDKNWKKASEKIHLWCLQNDMLCRSVALDVSSPLGVLIAKKWQDPACPSSHFAFVSEICQEYLREFPELTIYMGQLTSKVWTLYKYMWFTTFAEENESSFDRFLLWHGAFMQEETKDSDFCLKNLEEICKQTLPLMPFDLAHTRTLLSKPQKGAKAS